MTQRIERWAIGKTGYHLPRNGWRILFMQPQYVNRKLVLPAAFFASQHATKKGENQPNTEGQRKAGAGKPPAPAKSGPNFSR
ncbi:MAG: hypothetical protein VCE75_18690 [Alphaproteobacteria bacterium]|jgi:hypothetical protein